jgi:hypothetical protein
VVSRRTLTSAASGRRTYILEAEELVAAVAAQRAGVEEQLLERRDPGALGSFLTGMLPVAGLKGGWTDVSVAAIGDGRARLWVALGDLQHQT